jgi:hypothetical protein
MRYSALYFLKALWKVTRHFVPILVCCATTLTAAPSHSFFERKDLPASYTHAVLIAILPYINDFAKGLKLDTPLPVTTNMVRLIGDIRFTSIEEGVSASINCVNGDYFRFSHGRIDLYQSAMWGQELLANNMMPNHYNNEFYVDNLLLTPEEAVATVRQKLRDLGYDLGALYAQLTPRVFTPKSRWVMGKLHGLYMITWIVPNAPNRQSVIARVNGVTGKIEYLFLIKAPPKAPPKLWVSPIITPELVHFEQCSNQEKEAFFNAMRPGVEQMIRRLNLPLPLAFNRSQVREIDASRWRKALVRNIISINGYRFGSTDGVHVISIAAPDLFFGHHHVNVEEMKGEWKLSESRCMRIARDTVRKLEITDAAVLTSGRPTVLKPFLLEPPIVPRYRFEWSGFRKGKESAVNVEIDASRGRVAGIYYEIH